MNSFIEYPVMQVRPYGLLVYQRKEWDYPLSKRDPYAGLSESEKSAIIENRNKSFYTGKMTEYAKKRLTRAINLLVASAEYKEAEHFKTGKKFKFKVNFITLTLPAPQKEVTDKELKKQGLDNWIKRMKRKYKLNNYVWRAERQKNGNLHFHIIADTYLRFDHIRDDWNSILRKWHFIDDFKAKHGHSKPNSTDVHSVAKIKDLASYMVKYMCKDEKGNDTIDGKLWDCSKKLKIKHNCEVIVGNEEIELWDKCMDEKGVKVVNELMYSILFIPPNLMMMLLTAKIKDEWQYYLMCVREGMPKVEIEVKESDPVPEIVDYRFEQMKLFSA